ncbi:MAG: trypsin-like peptidase domain-containing protein [Gemmatimonadetes bacterium]|nr:trypsin-like peptidase domain-containing protein [Gemmatimonadota bacterium]
MTLDRLGKVHLLPLVLTTLLGAGAATLPRELHHSDPAKTPPAAPATPVKAAPAAATSTTAAADLSAAELSTAFVGLAKRVTPAVVRIEVKKNAGESSGRQQMQIPEPFFRFFGFPNPQGQQQQRQPSYEYAGGTGFIINPNGTIVTNNHVVSDAAKITVWLHDGRSLPGKVIGRDPTTDVAVVKINAKNLPTLSWGSSDSLQVGELVMAVGNPGYSDSQSLNYTVTTGIVSALGRNLPLIQQSLSQNPKYGQALAPYAISNYIQTDAVINPGNSGGPLVDVHGNVVGINSAIESNDGYYQGYGFAIPADLAASVAKQLIADGEVHRARLGVEVTGVTEVDAEKYNLPSVSGVLVQSVSDGTPAKGKLHQGDVIVGLNGKSVAGPGQLQSLVAEHQPGEVVTLSVYHNRSEHQVKVKLAEAPFHGTKVAHTRSAADASRIGLGLANPGSEAARQAGVNAQGALVVHVDPMGPAAEAGIISGDVITEANGHHVRTVSDLTKVLGSLKSGAIITLHVTDTSGQARIANVRVG